MYLIGFDFDGVIIDSREVMKKAWENVQNKYNFSNRLSFEKFLNQVGKPFPVIIENLGLESFMPQIMKYYFLKTSSYSNEIKLYKGINEILNFYNSRNIYKTVLITSKKRENTQKIISEQKLYFDLVITPEDTLRGKPSPEPLMKANEILKISCNNSIYIGDMEVDYLAANNAGWNYINADWGYGSFLENNKLIRRSNNPENIIMIITEVFF